MLQKITLIVTVILTGLAALGGATGMQLLPLGIALGLMYMIVYQGKKWSIPLEVIAILMLLINLTIFSWIDIATWGLVIFAFAKEK